MNRTFYASYQESGIIVFVKGCARYILLLCFLSLKESTYETRKNVFYFTSKVCFVLEKISLVIQVSRRHQMPKHKTRNTFY